jgi:hypothetical protein
VDIDLFNKMGITGGRYRFSVTFVECLLKNGLESPHKLFNEYIKNHIGCLPGDLGEPFNSNEDSLRIKVPITDFEWNELKLGRFVLQLTIPPFEIQ